MRRILTGPWVRATSFILALLLCGAQPAAADLSGSIREYYQEWSGMMASTAPGYYEGQTRGYMVGGSVIVKFPRKSVDLLSINPPRVKAGCGGIKLYGGAFSFANLEEFKDYAQAVLQDAVGLVFELALQHLTPSVAQAFRHIQNLLEQAKKYLSDSCYAAHALVKPLEGILGEALGEKVFARRLGEEMKDSGESVDANEARRRIEKGEDDSPEKRRKLSVNVAWAALKNIPGSDLFGSGNQGRELVMSFTGTTIIDYRNGFENPEIRTYLSDIDFDKLLNGWEAGDVHVLRCVSDYEKCLDVTDSTAPAFEGLNELVMQKLVDIVNKVERNKFLSEDETAFLNSVTFIPLRNYLHAASHAEGGMAVVVLQTAPIIAGWLAVNYYSEVYRIARQARADLPGEHNEPDEYRKLLEHLRENLELAMQKFSNICKTQLATMDATLTVIRTIHEMAPGLGRNLAFQARSELFALKRGETWP